MAHTVFEDQGRSEDEIQEDTASLSQCRSWRLDTQNRGS